MANNIALSAGVRQNLTALQNTSAMMSATQARLATGNKVNSALDNPINFFAALSLNNRANDLSILLDSIGQAQKVLETADQGLTSLTRMVESAKLIAKQVRESPQPTAVAYNGFTINATTQGQTLASHDGAAVTVANSTLYTFDININGSGARTVNFTSDASATYGEILAGLQADLTTELTTAGFTGRVTLNTGGGANDLKLDAVDSDIDFTLTAASANTGLTNLAYTSTSLLDNVIAAGGVAGTSTLTAKVNGGADQIITFGTGLGQVSTLQELDTALAGLQGVTADLTGGGLTALSFIVASSTTQNSLQLTGTTGVTTALGTTNATTNGTGSVSQPNAARTSLQNDYNVILAQLDTLAKDASYNGINLLYGDDLKVVFNEIGTSYLTISGVTFDSAGLGLSKINGTFFQDDTNVETTLVHLEDALTTLRNQASRFGSNLTTTQTRQMFTKAQINVLQTGSDNLVLADSNEEGAKLLALQTRQQLSTTALALSTQSDQAVLRLFG
jgi:flagellin-like hook-associated protein FlgL